MKKLIKWTVYPLLLIFISSMGLRIAGFRVFSYAEGKNSMYPTISSGDVVLCITGKTYSTYNLKRGAVILLNHRDYPYSLTKRIIGLPGDHVRIQGLRVDIDRERLDEPYLSPDLPDHNFGDIQNLHVPHDMLFVMGDNRADSLDSRYTRFGLVEAQQIVGKPLLILFSKDRHKIGKRLN